MMAAQENKITIHCSGCNNDQEYNLRNPNKIPKRPKTQCSNSECEKWIYIDRDQLVKKFGQKTMTKNDQKKDQIKPLKPSNPKAKANKLEKTEINPQKELTKTIDQRPKNNDQKTLTQSRIHMNMNFVKLLGEEMKQFNRTIPLDMKQELVNWLFKNIDQLYEGIYYYLNAWEKRYKKRLKSSPDSPVIPKYETMQKVFTKINELIQFKKNLENMKIKEQTQLEEVLKNTKIRK